MRPGLVAEFTAQGSFMNYLRQLKLDAESLIPPADEKKFLMHSKWEEAIDHVFDLFLPGPDANTYAALTSAQLTDRYLRAKILAITDYGKPISPVKGKSGAKGSTVAPAVAGTAAGLYTHSINLVSVSKLIYKAASYSCMKHHAGIVDIAATGDGIALMVILRDFATPRGSGSLEEARTKLRDHKLTAEGSKEDVRVQARSYCSH
jgi:hypothetical protein